MYKRILTLFIVLAINSGLAGCSSPPEVKQPADTVAITTSPKSSTMETPAADPVSAAPLVPEYEVELVAEVLRGECYDDQPDDKRKVVKVICNRVSAGTFGDSIEAVVTAPKQFTGYSPNNEPTANDYDIAREVLDQWYMNGCVPFDDYLFFSSGDGQRPSLAAGTAV